MLKFGVLVLLPFVLGGAPHGSGYASNRANNQGNRPGPAINMGSSGNNRMSITNFGPLPNKPNNILNPVNRQMRPTSRYNSDVPYQCTMNSDAGYFCPYRYRQPSTRYFFNVNSGRCESFYYLGCGGNLNNYRSREDCLSSCACFIYPDHGNYYCPYGGSIRWYFDKYSGTCQSFYYSGCNGGNDNNFQSQLECQSTCAPSNYGPYNMYPMPGGSANANVAMNSGAQSNANLGGPVRPNTPQQTLPNISNAPMPNIPNAPVPNVPNAPMPNIHVASKENIQNAHMINIPANVGVNIPVNMPNILNAPMPEPNFQGVHGINMHGSMGNEASTNGLNNGNNGVNINSIAQIWKMSTNGMDADKPPNGVNTIYPGRPNIKKSGLTMY
ncbi:uncharacterized protein LOC128178420 [Crassostrea angulata]|uniref:uncharacterized protein LOC128178420 n=1 Tax=Magallana angulata TaxID=2784310 RepID=UPI0022B16DB9|nr:uncharacterized protein LOC128178420 [Crassostrea angulata]